MNRILKLVERASLTAGFALLMLASLVWIDGRAHSQSAIADFERIRDHVATTAEQADWSPKRKDDYRRSLDEEAGETLAVLRIPSRNIEVPVFDSIVETALNRGAGHVTGTALPGEDGNVAIAGHRDGFFRGLKDIDIGDEIELMTLEGQQTFRVSQLDIVDPLDVRVLDPTDDSVVTLITCYPFYYVGAAPDRFIVRAALINKENNDEDT
jgi:sortase A